jgi:HAMP domain-containing protein
MSRTPQFIVLVALLLLLACTVFVSVYGALNAFARTRRRISLTELRQKITGDDPPLWLLWMCAAGSGSREKLAEWEQLLSGAGLRMNPLWYVCLKRIVLMLAGGALVLTWKYRLSVQQFMGVQPIVLLAVLIGAAAGILCDRLMWESLKRHRTNRIVEEIFAVSKQLLYFTGSPLHLHGKLSRCLPYTKLIRQEWHLLLNDWYQDPERAIVRFRYRLGTEEAYVFTETLQSLRLYDSEAYYSLLRNRVQDYKEKLELLRDSRKESASYLLFVLAGIPIMYTFQIFIHPWVQEGKHLFESLN